MDIMYRISLSPDLCARNHFYSFPLNLTACVRALKEGQRLTKDVKVIESFKFLNENEVISKSNAFKKPISNNERRCYFQEAS